MLHIANPVVASITSNLQAWAQVSQSFAGILTGLIAVLGVPLALRPVITLQRELRRYEAERHRRLDAEANLNLTAHFSLSHVHPADQALPRPTVGEPGAQGPEPQAGTRVLRMDLTLENVGEGAVDILACLAAARELEGQGVDVAAEGRDAQWSDLTRHYWNAGEASFSPGLSTTKHIVYAPDALTRVKAHSRKTLARVDQVRDFEGEKFLLYRVFVVARSSARNVTDLEIWTTLQRALLNVNSPAFREVSGEVDPLGLAASPDGWRLFLHHHEHLADPKLPMLRTQADREQRAVRDPEEYERLRARLDAELQDYCRRNLLPAWKAFRADLERMNNNPRRFAALLQNKSFSRRQRDVERYFPWDEMEMWAEYFYVTLEAE